MPVKTFVEVLAQQKAAQQANAQLIGFAIAAPPDVDWGAHVPHVTLADVLDKPNPIPKPTKETYNKFVENMYVEFCRILDFSIAEKDYAAKEAINNEKLCNCFMVVNGQLEDVMSYDAGLGTAITTEGTSIGIITLETFLPDAGIYYTENSPYLLQCKANRQWKRSMTKDNYMYSSVGSPDVAFRWSSVYGQTKKDVVDWKKHLYHWTNKIATKIDEDTWRILDYLYLKEINLYFKEKGMKCQIDPSVHTLTISH